MQSRRAPRSDQRVLTEPLEPRLLLSATIRVVAYNIEDDINGATTPLPGLYQVLEGVGEEKVQGVAQPIDILGLEETTSNSTTVAPIVTALNTYYNGAAVYAQSPYQATSSGGTVDDGNGPNAVVYNTKTLTLLASVGVGTPEGATNGEYRQVARYEFQPVGDSGSTGIFYVYVVHAKSLASGSTATDQMYQQEEATIIRNDEATLPANSSVIYMGDWNVDASTDPSMVEMSSAGQGQAFDPYNPTNQSEDWAENSTYEGILSESATDLRYRDDLQLVTQNVLNDTSSNLDYVAGSYHNFGNNGTTPVGGSVDSGTDTALNSDLVQDGGTFISATTLYADLTTASDHLPVVAEYTVPTTTVTPPPPTVPTIADAGFESPSIGNGYVYNPSGTGWVFTPGTPYGSGITGNGSGFTAGNPAAPQGTQVAFLQEQSTISQSVSGWTAGSYTLSFSASQRENWQHGGQNFEVLIDGAVVGTFRPSGTSYATYTTDPFTVTAGSHTITFQGLDTVGGDNTAFIDNVQVQVAAAGPVIADPGFESPAVGNGYVYNPTGTGWIFTPGTPYGSGITGNSSGFTAGNPPAPQGTQVAFLQEQSTISQSVNGWLAGTYVLSFSAAQRENYQHGGQNFEVLIDGVVVGTFNPSSTSYATYTTGPFTVTAGSHTVTFQGLDTVGGDNTAFIDNVQVSLAPQSLASA